ncbi:MAG: redox-regulated ATPase YchF [Anaerolineales bacterium]|nr:redox-regulated ATPase YchF [Anaerolineales bacterium]
MKLGIIGLPQSGKTTIFNALTRGNRPTTMGAGRVEVHTAVVDVPDPRLDALVEMYKPKKVSPAKVTYTDIGGMDGSAGKSGISGELLNHLSQVDGFLHVVRCFEDDNIIHSLESVDPIRDIEIMDSELWLNDLVTVEKKLEKLAEDRKKGGRDIVQIEKDQALFTRIHEFLSEEKPLRAMEDLNEEEIKSVAGFGFLTLKPMLVILNLSEGQEVNDLDNNSPYSEIVPLQGQLEMEISQLPQDEAEIFLNEYGITEPGLNRMIRLSYDLLGLQSFFTVGEDDCHAWTIKRGVNAQKAAGEIHSDLERGFIRAEIISYDDLIALGSIAKARDVGKLHLEGKGYIVQDGDIMHVRFNV